MSLYERGDRPKSISARYYSPSSPWLCPHRLRRMESSLLQNHTTPCHFDAEPDLTCCERSSAYCLEITTRTKEHS
jgi:hypothetical protein